MNILCVCTGNMCRSPMAEALLRRELEAAGMTEYTVSSAGTFTDDNVPASTEAITAMNGIGLDISDRRSRQITPAIVDETDIFVAMTTEHGVTLAFYHNVDPEKIVVPGAGIADPYGAPLNVYRGCRDMLIEAMPQLIEDIKAL